MKIEFLALHWAVTRKFRDYLYGSEFIIKTDNHPLSRMMTTKKTAADMGKLADLSDFNFRIEYRSGKSNLAADALSRNPIDEEDEDNICDQDQLQTFVCSQEGSVFIPNDLTIAISRQTMDDGTDQSELMCCLQCSAVNAHSPLEIKKNAAGRPTFIKDFQVA